LEAKTFNSYLFQLMLNSMKLSRL